jgi:hypothetical protein
MLGVHALIAVGEAVITTVAVAAVLSARPDLIAFGSVAAPGIAPGLRPAGEAVSP